MQKVCIRICDLPDFGNIETMLFTMYMRYRESMRPDGKINDVRYAELIGHIDYDFSAFEGLPDDFQLSIACRTKIFDVITSQYIEAHPEAQIVSLGSGLDFRFDRVDNGRIIWFDIDLPEVISLRRMLFGETERIRFVQSSVFDLSWMDQIIKNRSTLFIAEGLLVYLDPVSIKILFIKLVENFPGSEIVFDVYSNFYLRLGKLALSSYSFLNRMVSNWKWGLDDWSEIESWHRGIRLKGEYFQHDGFGDRIPTGFEHALNDDELPEGLMEELLKLSRVGYFALGA